MEAAAERGALETEHFNVFYIHHGACGADLDVLQQETCPLSPLRLLQVLSPTPLMLTSVHSRETSRAQSVWQSASETIPG